jgi:hypothetical protein
MEEWSLTEHPPTDRRNGGMVGYSVPMNCMNGGMVLNYTKNALCKKILIQNFNFLRKNNRFYQLFEFSIFLLISPIATLLL